MPSNINIERARLNYRAQEKIKVAEDRQPLAYLKFEAGLMQVLVTSVMLGLQQSLLSYS